MKSRDFSTSIVSSYLTFDVIQVILLFQKTQIKLIRSNYFSKYSKIELFLRNWKWVQSFNLIYCLPLHYSDIFFSSISIHHFVTNNVALGKCVLYLQTRNKKNRLLYSEHLMSNISCVYWANGLKRCRCYNTTSFVPLW